VAGVDVPQEGKKKPIRKSLYAVIPKGQESLKDGYHFYPHTNKDHSGIILIVLSKTCLSHIRDYF
jgi:hypothetical protein